MAKKQKIARSFGVPVEIEAEILPRLPVKSLLRFKCVKKSWRNLIEEDPTFISMHLNCSGKNGEFLLYDSGSHRYFKQHYYKGNDRSIQLLRSTKWVFGELQQAFIIGSCNGLVCLSNGLNFIIQDHMLKIHIWNPSTRKIMQLPPCHGDGDKYFVLGFGFCPKLNDYKVVKVIRSTRNSKPFEVHVYSLSMNSWKRIRVANPWWDLLPLLQHYEYINGASHWLGVEIKSRRMLIMSFKFDDEVFLEISMPNHHDFRCQIYTFFNVLFTEYQNRFSLISKRMHANVYDLWVMKEYGAADSWVKQFTIEVPPIPQDLPRLEQLIMNFENNGELILVVQDRDRSIVWIKQAKQIEEQPKLLILRGQVIRCKESLVSLPGESSSSTMHSDKLTFV